MNFFFYISYIKKNYNSMYSMPKTEQTLQRASVVSVFFDDVIVIDLFPFTASLRIFQIVFVCLMTYFSVVREVNKLFTHSVSFFLLENENHEVFFYWKKNESCFKYKILFNYLRKKKKKKEKNSSICKYQKLFCIV
jgi:hypothetical protein